jgi:hypothetical protein
MGGVRIQSIQTDRQRFGYAFRQRVDNLLSFLVALTELLAAGDSDVLSTIREQKHLLHHWSHCSYHRCAQSAPPLLGEG